MDSATITFKSGRADVNGISMYYEIYGQGKPLVLIHGGGSTIQSTFSNIIPALAKNHQVIAVELQAHGRTTDRDAPSSFEQDADDVAELLKQLQITKADVFGFSNGGNTTMQFAIRHPEAVNKIIVASAFYKRSGMPPEFWEGMKKATLTNMPPSLHEAFLKVTPDTTRLRRMFDRDLQRMLTFRDWDDAVLRSIAAPTLVVNGNDDVATSEHALAMKKLIPKSQLLIVPGGHGEYMGDSGFENTERKSAAFVLLIEEFLNQ